MAPEATRGDNSVERKIISVSVKRQITIPQKYYDVLGFSNEAECVLRDGGILLRPVQDRHSVEFSEQILADLIAKGYSGEELLEQFKLTNRQIRPAVERMIAEADDLAKADKGAIALDDLFGAED